MHDVRIQREADAASNHHLVLARMKMKLKKREVKRSTRHSTMWISKGQGDNRDLPT